MRASFSAVLLGIVWYFWLVVAISVAVTSLSTFVELMVPSTTSPIFVLVYLAKNITFIVIILLPG